MNPCLTAYLNCLLILLGGFLLINLMVYIYLRVKPDKSFEFAKNLFESFHSYQDIVDKSTDNYDIKEHTKKPAKMPAKMPTMMSYLFLMQQNCTIKNMENGLKPSRI